MWAALHGHKAAVDFIVARRADVNHKSRSASPLYCAAIRGHKDICEALLIAGADKTVTCDQQTAASWAARLGFKELAAFISSWERVCALFDAWFEVFVQKSSRPPPTPPPPLPAKKPKAPAAATALLKYDT